MGDRLATTDIGRKVGSAVHLTLEGPHGNTMSHGPSPTSVLSGILIHPAVWPQMTTTYCQKKRCLYHISFLIQTTRRYFQKCCLYVVTSSRLQIAMGRKMWPLHKRTPKARPHEYALAVDAHPQAIYRWDEQLLSIETLAICRSTLQIVMVTNIYPFMQMTGNNCVTVRHCSGLDALAVDTHNGRRME